MGWEAPFLPHDSFFSQTSEAKLDDIEGYHYPDPVEVPRMTVKETRMAINTSHSNKAAGWDTITSRVLKLALQ